MKSSPLLKISSILLLIFAAFVALFLLFGGAVATLGAALGVEGSGTLFATLILPVLSIGFQLAAGIVGVRSSRRPEKANLCIAMGVILLLISIAGTVSSTFQNVSDAQPMVGTIAAAVVGLILPVLYLAGALKLKKLGDG